MSATSGITQPETQAAQAPAEPNEAIVGAARQEVPKPEQAVAPASLNVGVQQAEAPAISAEAAQPAAASTPEASIAPKDRPPIIKPETSLPETGIPTTLASIAELVEASAAKQAGELIAQANASGANIPSEGLALTVKIDTPSAVATTPEAHACTGANCSHCAASAAKSEASAKPATEAAAVPAASTTTAPVAENISSPASSTQAAPKLVEQPAMGEAKPEGLATAPVTQVAAPAEHQGIAANKDKLAIGA